MQRNIKIGWIGTGIMGFHMCKHLIEHQYPLHIYNRTPSKAQPLLEKGAVWMKPTQIASNCDIVFIMLGYPKDVEQLCLGEEGILKYMKKGSILVDHTTSTPSLAVSIEKLGSEKGIISVDAPVSGGDVGAQQGKLVIMCGGHYQAITKIKPLMECYSRRVEHFGLAGTGQHNKMANQIILAGNLVGMMEGLLYASKMGLDINQVIDGVDESASSTVLSLMGKRMVKGDYEPGFYVEHFIKDMEIALIQAERLNLCLPCFSLIKQFYIGLRAKGKEKKGVQALIQVLEDINNHKL